MTIIVTGGAGFIGSNFIFYTLREHPEDRIICLDKLTYAGNLSTLAPVLEQPNFRFVKMDICDRDGVYGLFEEERPDLVINFAAESHVDRSIQDPSIFLQTNVIGTSVLMDACRKYGKLRFHQVSTDEVYGDLPGGRTVCADRHRLYDGVRHPAPHQLRPRRRVHGGGHVHGLPLGLAAARARDPAGADHHGRAGLPDRAHRVQAAALRPAHVRHDHTCLMQLPILVHCLQYCERSHHVQIVRSIPLDEHSAIQPICCGDRALADCFHIPD